MADPTIAQDPGELFDVVTGNGEPTGMSKPRALVHRDGDWHRAVHVWVVGEDEQGPFLTFQRRSLAKDTQPGKLDATVGGHVRAGEGIEQTLREVEEEIGVAVTREQLRHVGTRICVHEGERGVIDRELQEVFLLRDERPLTAFRPHPAELAGLVRFPLGDLLPFLAGDAARARGTFVATETSAPVEMEFGWEDFIVRVDRYPLRVAIAAAAFLRGERYVAV